MPTFYAPHSKVPKYKLDYNIFLHNSSNFSGFLLQILNYDLLEPKEFGQCLLLQPHLESLSLHIGILADIMACYFFNHIKLIFAKVICTNSFLLRYSSPISLCNWILSSFMTLLKYYLLRDFFTDNLF